MTVIQPNQNANFQVVANNGANLYIFTRAGVAVNYTISINGNNPTHHQLNVGEMARHPLNMNDTADVHNASAVDIEAGLFIVVHSPQPLCVVI